MKLHTLSELQYNQLYCGVIGAILLVGGIVGIFIKMETASLIIGTVCVIFSLLGLFQLIHVPDAEDKMVLVAKQKASNYAFCVMWFLLLSFSLGVSNETDIQVLNLLGWNNFTNIIMGISLLVYIICYTKFEKVAE